MSYEDLKAAQDAAKAYREAHSPLNPATTNAEKFELYRLERAAIEAGRIYRAAR